MTTTASTVISEPAELTGNFEKEGHDMFSSFQMRRFVMSNGNLTYFKDREEKGRIMLANYRIKLLPDKPLEVKLKHPTNKKMHVRFRNSADCDMWKKAFEEHIEYYSTRK